MSIPEKKLYTPSGGQIVKFIGGVPQSKAESYYIYVPIFEGNIEDIAEQALLIASDEYLVYQDATVELMGRVSMKNCDGENEEYWQCKVSTDLESTEFNIWNWTVRSALTQEIRTTDYQGRAVIVGYPPAVDWFSGGTSLAVFYKKFETQLPEMSVYVPGSEIQGTRRRLISKENVDLVVQRTRTWQGRINSSDFFGWAQANVLCLGLDVRFTHKLRNDGYIIDETVRFLCRPGGGVQGSAFESVNKPISPDIPGGWHEWVYWKDPQTGLIPSDTEPEEVQHYPYGNFNQMLTTSEDVLT